MKCKGGVIATGYKVVFVEKYVFGHTCAHLIGIFVLLQSGSPYNHFCHQKMHKSMVETRNCINQQEIKFWMSKIGPTVQKVCLFMCHKSNFVNFKDIIWLQIYFLLSQEYIEPE